jgi:hypothetical protein
VVLFPDAYLDPIRWMVSKPEKLACQHLTGPGRHRSGCFLDFLPVSILRGESVMVVGYLGGSGQT